MKKLSTLIIVLFVAASAALSQTAGAEAKAAYLLAEEAYATGDWKGTLNYLEECKSKLGSANSKVLYLQLMTEMELAKTDKEYFGKALQTIAAFEKAPDVKEFNEEKMLEVMKTKLRIRDMKAKDIEAEKMEKERIVKAREYFKTWSWEGLPLQVSYDQLEKEKKKARQPLFSGLTRKIKKGDEPGLLLIADYSCFASEFSCKDKGLRGVYVQDDIIKGYIGNYSYRSHTVGSLSQAEATKEALQIPNDYSYQFGLQPVVEKKKKNAWENEEIYTWTLGHKRVSFIYTLYKPTSGKTAAYEWAVYTRFKVIEDDGASAGVVATEEKKSK